jgi:hypothetical protein
MDESLAYIINHVFLPPQLPQEDDSDHVKSLALESLCKTALEQFQRRIPDEQPWGLRVQASIRMMGHMIKLRERSGDMLPQEVATSLGNMGDKGMLKRTVRAINCA